LALSCERRREPTPIRSAIGGTELRISFPTSRRFALTIILALVFFAGCSVANGQPTAQEVSSSNGAKDSVTLLDRATATESSSLQDPQAPPKDRKPPDQCGVTSAKQCVKDFLNDQKGMWTSPFHIKPKDAEWLLPIAAATAVSIRFDAEENTTLGVSRSRDIISRRLTDIGSPYSLVGFAATAYLIGHFTHNENARETGVLSAEALADTALITEILKYATNRERPFEGNGRGDFYPDGFHNYPAGLSMPSGHAASAFAVAKIISDETRGHTWLHLGLYALATTIGAARITGHEHFPSDVIVGGTFGYLIGGYIYHHRASDPTRRGEHGLLLGMAPITDANTHTYGMTILTNGDIFRSQWLQHLHFGAKKAPDPYPILTGAN
jgi:membrane-associated phospholipid phosphatase